MIYSLSVFPFVMAAISSQVISIVDNNRNGFSIFGLKFQQANERRMKREKKRAKKLRENLFN